MDPFSAFDTTISQVNRYMLGVGLGYYFNKESLLKLSFITIDDYANNLFGQSPEKPLNSSSLKKNVLFSTTIKANLFKNMNIIGEVAYSLYCNDKNYQLKDSFLIETDTQINNGHTSKIKKTFFGESSVTTTEGLAYNVEAIYTFQKTRTDIRTQFKKVDNAYESLGVPFLIKNLSRTEIGVEQSLFSNKVRLGAFIRKEKTLDEEVYKPAIDKNDYGLDVMISLPKLPVLTFNMKPIRIVSDSFDYKLDIIMGMLNYSLVGDRLTHNLSTVYFWQQGNNQLDDSKVMSENIDIIYTLGINESFNISATYSHSVSTMSDTSDQYNSIGADIIWNTKKVMLSGGADINLREDEESKVGGYLSAQTTLFSKLSVGLRMEKRVYRNLFESAIIPESYNQLNGFLTIGYQW